MSKNLMKFKILGDYSGGVHLFPFRTEKLSPPAQMVLQLNVGEYVVASFLKPEEFSSGFFLSLSQLVPLNLTI
jgi:hypothetical protein